MRNTYFEAFMPMKKSLTSHGTLWCPLERSGSAVPLGAAAMGSGG